MPQSIVLGLLNIQRQRSIVDDHGFRSTIQTESLNGRRTFKSLLSFFQVHVFTDIKDSVDKNATVRCHDNPLKTTQDEGE
ncbi:hypothetical protein D3C72_920030 [compost metagenome]